MSFFSRDHHRDPLVGIVRSRFPRLGFAKCQIDPRRLPGSDRWWALGRGTGRHGSQQATTTGKSAQNFAGTFVEMAIPTAPSWSKLASHRERAALFHHATVAKKPESSE